MPIRVNLLTDALAAEELRRHDPAKYAAFLGVVIVALSLVWYSSAWLNGKRQEHSLGMLQRQIETQTNDVSVVQNNQKRIAELQARLDALDKLNRARFLQGNLLNALQQAYVTNVQLLRAHVEQTYVALPGTPAKTTPSGLIPAHPGAVVEHIVLRLDAKDSGPTPGDLVNPFKDAVSSLDYIKNAVGSTNGISLANMSPSLTGSDGRSYVNFTIECRFAPKP